MLDTWNIRCTLIFGHTDKIGETPTAGVFAAHTAAGKKKAGEAWNEGHDEGHDEGCGE